METLFYILIFLAIAALYRLLLMYSRYRHRNLDTLGTCHTTSVVVCALLKNSQCKKDSFFYENILLARSSRITRFFLLLEMFWIAPRKYPIYQAHQLFDSVNTVVSEDSTKNYADYVTFTRANFSTWDKISCDWCSIVNGMLEYSLDSIKECIMNESEKLLELNFDYNTSFNLRYMKYLPYSVIKGCYNKEEIRREQMQYVDLINTYYKKTTKAKRNRLIKHVKKLVELKIVVSYVERRWCPLAHLQKMAYRRNYHTFDSRNRRHLEKAAAILKEISFIDINRCELDIKDCNQKINNALEDPVDMPSLFNEYMQLFSEQADSHVKVPINLK